jgi:hypothetical protein
MICVPCTHGTHNQDSGTPNEAQRGRNTKDRENQHPITSKLIIIIITTKYFKSTIDKVHSALGSLNNMLPEEGPVWSKHVAHKHRMYIYFNDIIKHFNYNLSELNVD